MLSMTRTCSGIAPVDTTSSTKSELSRGSFDFALGSIFETRLNFKPEWENRSGRAGRLTATFLALVPWWYHSVLYRVAVLHTTPLSPNFYSEIGRGRPGPEIKQPHINNNNNNNSIRQTISVLKGKDVVENNSRSYSWETSKAKGEEENLLFFFFSPVDGESSSS